MASLVRPPFLSVVRGFSSRYLVPVSFQKAAAEAINSNAAKPTCIVAHYQVMATGFEAAGWAYHKIVEAIPRQITLGDHRCRYQGAESTA